MGGVCALANVLGGETCELYSLAKDRKIDEAKVLQQRLVGPNTAVSNLMDKNKDSCIFWLIWFINQEALCNHALPVLVVGVGIGIVVVCAHLSLPQS